MSKYGFQNGIQRFKCASCNKIFAVEQRINTDTVWQEYTEGKQTYLQLASKYGCSLKTIQRRIDTVKAQRQTTFPSVVNLLMDTTYFGRKLGVMVFKDSLSGQILYKQYVKTETNKLYLA